MKSTTLRLRTSAREEILLVTDEVNQALRQLTTGDGLCTVYTPHTTTAVSINEDADPDVRIDVVAAIRAMVPKISYRHGEGNSDAHLMSSLIGVSVTVPFHAGRLWLGRWQGIYFIELDGPRERELQLHVIE